MARTWSSFPACGITKLMRQTRWGESCTYNNTGRDVTISRDEAVTKGVTINGLVILSQTQMSSNSEHANEHTNPPGGVADYYRNNVIGGPGAFVMVAENASSFGNALVKKLIAEIAQKLPQR
jgi:Protein of unknown function (DUF1194)